MDKALQALNRLVEESVIEGYAIGGAVGAAIYISAAQTEDLDAFVLLRERQQRADDKIAKQAMRKALQQKNEKTSAETT